MTLEEFLKDALGLQVDSEIDEIAPLDQTLITLASQYAEMRVKEVVDGLPKEREIHPMYSNRTSDVTDWEQYDIGYNQALNDCRKSIVERLGKGRDET